MTMTVINNRPDGTMFKDFDVEGLVYGDPRKTSNGGTMVPFTYAVRAGMNELTIQTERMRGPFGVSRYQRDNSKTAQLSLQLSIDEKDTDFLRFIQALDKAHIKAGVNNVAKWFSRPMLPHAVEVLYKKTPVEAKDPSKYRPTIRFKINKDTQFWDENKQPLDIDDIKPGSEFIVLARTSMLWFTGGQFAPSMTLLQAKVFPPEMTRVEGYAIQDDGDDDQMF